MIKTIQALDLERSCRRILQEVVREHVPYVVTQDSRPEAAIVPYDEFLNFQKFQEEEVLARFDEMWQRMAEKTAAYSEEEVAEDIAAARSELAR